MSTKPPPGGAENSGSENPSAEEGTKVLGKCMTCGQEFPDKQALDNHIQTAHVSGQQHVGEDTPA